MQRLDIIINALELASHVPKGVVYPAGYPMQIAQALTAARELKALKPVAKVNSEGFIVELGLGLSSGTKLYALDEVTK